MKLKNITSARHRLIACEPASAGIGTRDPIRVPRCLTHRFCAMAPVASGTSST